MITYKDNFGSREPLYEQRNYHRQSESDPDEQYPLKQRPSSLFYLRIISLWAQII